MSNRKAKLAASQPHQSLPSEIYVNAKVDGSKVKTNLAEYFHLPCREVAQQLGICEQTIKNACRLHGVARWPHQQVRCLPGQDAWYR